MWKKCVLILGLIISISNISCSNKKNHTSTRNSDNPAEENSIQSFDPYKEEIISKLQVSAEKADSLIIIMKELSKDK